MVQSQTQQNYIGINGIVTQDLNSIIAELKNDFKGIYGENINLESNTSDGQWLNILAQQKIDALDFQVQLYNNLDVDSVVGLPQQVLYKLNGLTIKDFTYSFVYVNVTVSQNVSLSGLDDNIANTDGTGYTVTDINGNNWILAESISLVQNNEPYLLLFRAQELGQITALANSITTMSTIVAGVTGVSNPANNFITGQTGETAAEFRTRRNRSLQAPSQGFKESIEGQLLALNDVSDAKVYDNKDDENIDGVQVIVQGGTSNEIGNIIYNNLPPGINTQGAYEATITVNNRNKVLNYDKPNPIPILVKGTIESLTGNVNDIDINYVKQTLASKQFNIGEIAESANITTELKNILGETGSPYDIELSLGATGGEWSDVSEYDSIFTTYEAGLSSIAYGNNIFVAGGDDGIIATSSDGANWSNFQTVGEAYYRWTDIKYINNQFIAVGHILSGKGKGIIATSSDGINWGTPIVIEKENDFYILNVIYSNNKYYMGCFPNTIMTSSDLSSFDYITLTTDNVLSGFRIIEGDNKFVIKSNGGYTITSSDGANWSTPYKDNIYTTSLMYDTKGNYIIGYSDGRIAISTNLINWDIQTVGSNNWSKVFYYNDLYIAIGRNGHIAMSEDLINWTQSQIGNNNWYDITSHNSLLVLVGGKEKSGYTTTYTFPSIDWQEILTPSGLADFYVMTVSGMDNLTVLGAD